MIVINALVERSIFSGIVNILILALIVIVIVIALSIILATVSWHFVEKPC